MKLWYMLQHGWILKTWCYVKEARHNRPHIAWFHFLWNVQIRQIYTNRKYIKSFPDAGSRGELGVTANGHWVSLGWQHSKYTKNHFKMASFMLCEFHLNFLNSKKSQCSNKEYHGISMAIIRIRNGFSIMKISQQENYWARENLMTYLRAH